MTVLELKNILDEYSNDTEVSTCVADENKGAVFYDFDDVVLYDPALSSETLGENHLTLCLVERD